MVVGEVDCYSQHKTRLYGELALILLGSTGSHAFSMGSYFRLRWQIVKGDETRGFVGDQYG